MYEQLRPMTAMSRGLELNCFELNKPDRAGQKNAKRNRTYNNNNIITFDTETTSVIANGKKCSFVYVATMCVNGYVYYTRDLIEFKTFLDRYNDDRTVNVIWIHNLGFDFSFLQNVIPFDDVFARKPHRPIYARYKNWEFRCSYFLSQMSLRTIGESYKLEHAKLIDGLDYGKIRTPETELTETEEDYIQLDVVVLYEYIQYMLKNHEYKYKNIPYTQTGFVRRYILEYSKQCKQYFTLRNIVTNTKPDQHLFDMLERAYTGGYTHANYIATGTGLYRNVKSYDITSSYPSVMVRKKFPIGAFKKLNCNFKKYIDSDDYSCVGRFLITGLHAKSALCYISKHKCINLVNGVVNNGRLFSADSFEIFLTDVDIHTIKMMYDCKIQVLEMYAAKSGYLPKCIVMAILQLYKNKTEFKGIKEKHALYMSAKQMINSVYGMSVFNPFCDDVIYNLGEWSSDPATFEKLEKYFDNKKTILPYQWGVWVTAYARYNLCNVASKIGDNVLYMDTDSIKFIGDFGHLFTNDDRLIHAENKTVSEFYNIDFSYFAPSDIDGKTHEIGLWDFEYTCKSFKCLGAKRYCYTKYHDNEIYPVVAGCPTDSMRTWLKLHNCNALLKSFQLNLFIDKPDSGKNTITYHGNHNFDISVRDYTGKISTVHIGYGAYIEPATFDMSLHDDYFKFLLGYAVSDRGQLIRNGVVSVL